MFGHHIQGPAHATAHLAVDQGYIIAVALRKHIEILLQRAEIRLVVWRFVGAEDDLKRFVQIDRIAIDSGLDSGREGRMHQHRLT